MGVAVFPQAVVSPSAYERLQTIMVNAGGVPFQGGYPSGSDARLGDGWMVSMTYDGGLWPSTIEALDAMGVTIVSVPVGADGLHNEPVIWNEHTAAQGKARRWERGTLARALRDGWFAPDLFRHTGGPAHKVLAAETAGGVLPRAFPDKAHLA